MAWAWVISGIFVVLCVLALRWARRFGPLGGFITALILGALFFRVVFPGYESPWGGVLPGMAMAVANSSFPLPLPATAFWSFMVLMAIGGLVVVTSNDQWMRAFFGPILSFLRGDVESLPAVVRRAALYGLIPLAVGWIILRGFMPSAGAPSNRARHIRRCAMTRPGRTR